MDVFGVLIDGVHYDVSNTEKGAKRYASLNNLTKVTIRYNLGYVAAQLSEKINGKWKKNN